MLYNYYNYSNLGDVEKLRDATKIYSVNALFLLIIFIFPPRRFEDSFKSSPEWIHTIK